MQMRTLWGRGPALAVAIAAAAAIATTIPDMAMAKGASPGDVVIQVDASPAQMAVASDVYIAQADMAIGAVQGFVGVSSPGIVAAHQIISLRQTSDQHFAVHTGLPPTSPIADGTIQDTITVLASAGAIAASHPGHYQIE